MLISDTRIHAISQKYKSTSFIIERFLVPRPMTGLRLEIEVVKDTVATILVYDADFTLRAELQGYPGRHVINIFEQAERTSLKMKAGEIPEGEWTLALDLKKILKEDIVDCRLTVFGEEKVSI